VPDNLLRSSAQRAGRPNPSFEQKMRPWTVMLDLFDYYLSIRIKDDAE
jgi:hypothetical protein